jgi:hypothetical protein
LARNKNFSVQQNYKDGDSLISTAANSRTKNLSHIKTHADLDKLLNYKVSKIKDFNKSLRSSPKGTRLAQEMTLNGIFVEASPDFKPTERKMIPYESQTEMNVFGHRNSSIDPGYTTHKPYGYKVEDLPFDLTEKLDP